MSRHIGRDPYIPGLGDRLRLLLNEAELSQKALARRLGIERKTVGRWVNGDSAPNAYMTMRLCEIFKASADWLLFGKEVDYDEGRDKG